MQLLTLPQVLSNRYGTAYAARVQFVLGKPKPENRQNNFIELLGVIVYTLKYIYKKSERDIL